jgi:peptide/nickel transport system substrate-binding protein
MKLFSARSAALVAALATVSASFVALPASAAAKILVVDTAFQLTSPDPGRQFEMTGNMIVRTLYSSLLTYKGGDIAKPIPDLATSWKASADAKVYTFTLNKKAVFSDGTHITSADVVWSLNRLKYIKGNPSSLMAGITPSAPNASTVVLTSEQANTAIPSIVTSPSLGVVNRKVVIAHGGTSAPGSDTTDKALSYLMTHSAGSGPYILKSFGLTTQVVLVKNPKYWGTKAAYDKIVLRNVPGNIQRLNVIKGASQVAVDLSPSQASGIKNLNIVKGQSSNFFFVYASQNKTYSPATKFTSNPKCVEAIRYGVNYDKIIKYAGTGAIQAAGVIPSVYLGALTQADRIKQDLPRAKAAYEACGVGNTLVTVFDWSDGLVNGISFSSLATLVAEDLRLVGFNIAIKGAPIAVSLPLYRDNQEEIGVWMWGSDWPDSSNYTESFSPGTKVGLRMGWQTGADPVIEQLRAAAAVETNITKRAALYRQWQLDMNKTSPIVPLLQPAAIVVGAKSVKGLASNAIWIVNLSELK